MREKIHYVDIGARGDLGEPWKSLEKKNRLFVYGFEADPVEHDRLRINYPFRKYYPVALACKEGSVKLHITNEASQSSIYPPSSNQQFESQHWKTRQVKKELDIPCSTLDILLVNETVDAIKIDTQGGEYEILKGGVEIINFQRPILFLETWCHPVYSDAPLMHEILQLTYSLGYELWATEPAAAWRYRIDNENLNMQHTRQRLIGLNLMLVPRLELLKKLDTLRVRARVEILRLYGFLDSAFLLADHVNDDQLKYDLKKQIRLEGLFPSRLIRKTKRIVSREGRYPPIT